MGFFERLFKPVTNFINSFFQYALPVLPPRIGSSIQQKADDELKKAREQAGLQTLLTSRRSRIAKPPVIEPVLGASNSGRQTLG